MAGASSALDVPFTPTSASWLNAVEGYFAKLTRRRLKRGVFRSIVELQAAIKRFLAETNADPRPFRWTKDPDKIIAAVKRGHQVLDSIHYCPRLTGVDQRLYRFSQTRQLDRYRLSSGRSISQSGKAR